MQALDQVQQLIQVLRSQIVIGDTRGAATAACGIVKNIFEDAPTLGLDLDGTIDESPLFFQLLTQIWPGAVVIITYRDDYNAAVEYAQILRVHFDKLVVVNSLDAKAQAIAEHKVAVYIDDQDECLANIPDSVTVLKIRNDGNSRSGKWLYSRKTGFLI